MSQRLRSELSVEIISASCFLEEGSQCWVIQLKLISGTLEVHGYAFEGGGFRELLFEIRPTSPPPAFLSHKPIIVAENNNALIQFADHIQIHPRFLQRIIQTTIDRCWFIFTTFGNLDYGLEATEVLKDGYKLRLQQNNPLNIQNEYNDVQGFDHL